MSQAVIYIHGKGGSAAESEHFLPLFPGDHVIGLDYRSKAPRKTGAEIRAAIEDLKKDHESVILIANSIGAFFCLNADLDDRLIRRAYFISPVLDMERLILDMLGWAGATETDLKTKGVIPTAFGEDLCWDVLCYVRSHPIHWDVPTNILYGSGDVLIPRETVEAFAKKHNANLTVLQGGEHWFHTEEQMRFLDDWIRKGERK